MEEHIYASERKGEMIYRVVDPQTKCETDDERVIAVKEGPLHGVFPSSRLRWLPEFWKVPVDSVKQMLVQLLRAPRDSPVTRVFAAQRQLCRGGAGRCSLAASC